MKSISRIVVVLGALVVGVAVAGAQTDPVKERKALMKEVMAANAKLGADMIKGVKPFDAAKAEEAMKAAAAVPDKFMPLLVKGTFIDKNEDTTAKPEIATNMDDFEKRMEDLEAALIAAAGAAKAGPDQFKTAFSAATKQCGGCHEVYRIKK